MSQSVQTIKMSDLVLWTENPRDPIRVRVSNQQIVDRAVSDPANKWNLLKLAREMGPHYDYSELPTVVFRGKTPVVYDGNRRVALGMIAAGLVKGEIDIDLPDFPDALPCNVCSEDIALMNVYRKHAETGSWAPLERDIFLNKHMGEEKTAFLVIEEATGLISGNPHLNQRFVKEEIFHEDVLEKLGILVRSGKVTSRHSSGETRAILEDISRKVKDKTISTRHNRGKVKAVLDPHHQKLIEEHKAAKPREVGLKRKSAPEVIDQRRTRRTQTKAHALFGGPLFLSVGAVSNLYRDIVDLEAFYTQNKDRLSASFAALLRMALRLLCETAAKDRSKTLDGYVRGEFAAAKASLDQNAKTTLANQNVTESSIVQLLHTGAHNYAAAANVEQTMAMSIVIGAILTGTHGKAAS